MYSDVIWDAVPAPAQETEGNFHIIGTSTVDQPWSSSTAWVSEELVTQYTESAVRISCVMYVSTYTALLYFAIQIFLRSRGKTNQKREYVWHMQTLWLAWWPQKCKLWQCRQADCTNTELWAVSYSDKRISLKFQYVSGFNIKFWSGGFELISWASVKWTVRLTS